MAHTAFDLASSEDDPYKMSVKTDDDGVPVIADLGLERAKEVIALKESGGNYRAIGPADKRGDRPYGRYQVMGANIGPWTKKWYGRELTPEQFLADDKAQDAVFRGEFGSYYKKHGNWQDAASLWHSGKPFAQSGRRKDVLGTRTHDYVQDFNRLFSAEGPINVAATRTGAPGPLPGTADPTASPQIDTARSALSLGDSFGDAFGGGRLAAGPITKPNVPLWGGDMLGTDIRNKIRNA